jgi:hypothetical protein
MPILHLSIPRSLGNVVVYSKADESKLGRSISAIIASSLVTNPQRKLRRWRHFEFFDDGSVLADGLAEMRQLGRHRKNGIDRLVEIGRDDRPYMFDRATRLRVELLEPIAVLDALDRRGSACRGLASSRRILGPAAG